MKKLIAMLGLVVFGAFGCAGSKFPTKMEYTHKAKPDIQYSEFEPVYIDATFTPDEKAQIKEGINELNTVLNGYYTYFVANENLDASSVITTDDDAEPSSEIKNILSAHEGIVLFNLNDQKMIDSVDDGVLGFTLTELDVIFLIPQRIGFRNFRVIALHEMLHTLSYRGMEHSNIKGTIEYPYYGGNYAGCIDYTTMLGVASALNLPKKDLNYCGDLPKE